MLPRSGRPTSSIDRHFLPRTTLSLLTPQTRLSHLSTVNTHEFSETSFSQSACWICFACHSQCQTDTHRVSHPPSVPLFLQVWFSARSQTTSCTPSEASCTGGESVSCWTISTCSWGEQSYATRSLLTDWLSTLVCAATFHSLEKLDTDIDFRRRLIAARRCWQGPYSFSGKVKWFLTNLLTVKKKCKKIARKRRLQLNADVVSLAELRWFLGFGEYKIFTCWPRSLHLFFWFNDKFYYVECIMLFITDST